jgi:hypothetical protein
MMSGNDSDVVTLDGKRMHNRIYVRIYYRALIEDGRCADIVDFFNVLYAGKSPLTSDITDYPEIDRHCRQRIVLILHHENALSSRRQVLAKLLVACSARLINFEVGSKIIDFDDTKIVFCDDAAMRHRRLREPQTHDTKNQEKETNPVHNRETDPNTLVKLPKK